MYSTPINCLTVLPSAKLLLVTDSNTATRVAVLPRLLSPFPRYYHTRALQYRGTRYRVTL